jgi:hypothetical protein
MMGLDRGATLSGVVLLQEDEEPARSRFVPDDEPPVHSNKPSPSMSPSSPSKAPSSPKEVNHGYKMGEDDNVNEYDEEKVSWVSDRQGEMMDLEPNS